MTDDTLYRLDSNASILVTEDLMTGDTERYSESRLQEYRTDTGLTANLTALDQVIDYVVNESDDFEEGDEGDESIDAAVGPAVRKYIDIPLRDAGDPRIWHYLAVGRYPEFVRYRWPRDTTDRTHKSMKEKFLGSTQDLYTNAFSRLWFMAEFSRDGDDYTETEGILAQAYRSNRIFDRMDLRRYRTGRALSKIANSEPDEDVLEDTAKAVSHQWSVTSEGFLLDKELKDLISDIHGEVS
jgi:hypothetical protein